MGSAMIGLIVGTVIGQFTNSSLLIWQSLREHDKPLLPRLKDVTKCASRRVNFPKFLIPSGILETMSAQLHVFMLSTIFGTAVTGSIGLYQKSVSVPIRTFGNAIRQVFRQRAAQDLNQKDECLELFNRTIRVLFIIALPIAVLMYVFAPTVFPWVFGDEWREAGQFARILAPMFLCSFVASPVSSLILIGERQKYDLFLQVLLLVLTVGALLIGGRLGDANLAVLLFGFAHCVKSLAELGITRQIAAGRN
jgi:O-antigen/teichoic acid export membrane protein